MNSEKYIKSFKKITTSNGMFNICVNTYQGKKIFFYDNENLQREVNFWVENIPITKDTAYIVCGFGLGYHVQLLLEKIPQSSYIYVLEPDIKENSLEIAKKIFKKQELFWLKDQRVGVLADSFVNIVTKLESEILQKGLNNVFFASFNSVVQIFKSYYKPILETLPTKINILLVGNLNFRKMTAFQYLKNFWRNFPYIVKSQGIESLKTVFKNKMAIIVAAGPSLDKNIEQIKAFKGKVPIIAAGSAVGALTEKNIEADFVIAIDPFEGNAKEIYEHVMPQTSLVASNEVVSELIENFQGRCFFATNPASVLPESLKTVIPSKIELLRSSSVAITAVSFAYEMGAKIIVLVGQDLALSSDCTRHHAKGTKANSYDLESVNLTVKGQDGALLPAIPLFKQVLSFYQVLFRQMQGLGIKIINATEGGAYIDGAEHRTLQSVIDEFLKGLFKTDFAKEIENNVLNATDFSMEEVLFLLSEAFVEACFMENELLQNIKMTEELLKEAEITKNESLECFAKISESIKNEIKKIKEKSFFKEYLSYYMESYFLAYRFNKQIKESVICECRANCELIDELFFIVQKVKAMLNDNIKRISEPFL